MTHAKEDASKEKAGAQRTAGLVSDAMRMGFKILWWSFVIGLALSSLFSASSPETLSFPVIFKRALIIGGALAGAIIIVTLLLPKGLRGK